MKNVLLIAFLTVIGTVVWAQRDKFLSIVSPIITTEKANSKGVKPFDGKVTTQKPPTMINSNQALGSATTATASQDDGKPSSDQLSVMLEAFDRILGLTEEQKEEVTHQNEKTIERINDTRQRTDADVAWKETEITRLKTFRDTQIQRILQPKQASKWQQFQESKEAIKSLNKLNQQRELYVTGKQKYYPESEYGAFRSLSEIDQLAQSLKNTANQIMKQSEVETLTQTIYNF